MYNLNIERKLNQIPTVLKELNQWVCADRDSKVPLMAMHDSPASCSDPSTWTSFDMASLMVITGQHDYLGFAFNDSGIVGIDIDKAIDEAGIVSDVLLDIATHVGSYTEFSRSGRGIHIFVKGDLPFNGRNNRQGVEIYKTGRYFITTGNRFSSKYAEIVENQEGVNYVLEKYFPETRGEHTAHNDRVIYSPLYVDENGKRLLPPVYPPIPEGARNISLTSLAGQLRNAGYSQQGLYKELLKANEVACKPPLSKYEVAQIVNSIMKYERMY